MNISQEKIIKFDFLEINEMLKRRFLYMWQSVEFFLKDGRSYLFNLFHSDINDRLFALFKVI